MLVLTRRVGEKIMIGDNIEVLVLAVKGLNTRLAIKAPHDVAVHREEIYEKIQKEKQFAEEKRGNQEL